jgi:SAM-dependent methyltransferase
MTTDRAGPPARAGDWSHVVHGALYHLFYDRPLAEARRRVVEAVPESSRVLDIACGTGQLCFELAERKGCRVVGVDLSHRMIGFARKRNRYTGVRFELADATSLPHLEQDSFDVATILFLLHEVPRVTQVAVLVEALRLSRRVIAVDSGVPLPRNLHGLALRAVELIGGPGHYGSFRDYLDAGGIGGVLEDSRVSASVRERSVFWHGCRDITILERHTGTSG